MPNTSLFHETPEQTIEHMQFQMSLLRLTALPGEARASLETRQEKAAEALLVRKQASTADLVLEELSLAVNGSVSR